ncbi:PEP-CTERM sorting domain-containing protein [Verrucomicrobiaceae bacterium N1E253]|uniref:PEP-CTERM sorting domain-containing protein n=1 Tax=Oceaniferula marina TaxID=2748318 RepID=A0A851GKK3_9BACT|nr:PEP-CTERM sorting domain-containing protein [Oceaniferula marina]NWK55705.1 PEP-CTERM sorting domain-containing protein [Oceaniferula marina]
MKIITAASLFVATAMVSQAATVFTDDFTAYTSGLTGSDAGNALLGNGWTSVTNNSSNGFGFNGRLYGYGSGSSANSLTLSRDHATDLLVGDTITMDATINTARGGAGYDYAFRILINGVQVAQGLDMGDDGAGNVNQLSYTVDGSTAGAAKTVTFEFGHYWNWGESESVTFAVDTVPEPSSSALLGLGGLALILRRRK